MNTKLLLVSLAMALSAVSMPVMAQSTPTEVRISDTKQTITVGDNSINFYDEGGPTGQTTPRSGEVKRISEITFVPANPAKKVMVKRSQACKLAEDFHAEGDWYRKIYG